MAYSEKSRQAAKIAEKSSYLKADEILYLAAAMVPPSKYPSRAFPVTAIENFNRQQDLSLEALAQEFVDECEKWRYSSRLKDILGVENC